MWASMDTINKTGHEIRTQYGPNLEIKALAFVDDLSSAGNKKVANNTIGNCRMMEERKKMTFNTEQGKSAVMIINRKKYNESITERVKNGEFREVKEYKYLGVWINSSGSYKTNIMKKKEKVSFMITTIKMVANDKNMGKMATRARIKMMESVIMPSILYGSEAYAQITKEEMKELEKIQGEILRRILEVPKTTPYEALLMETGVVTMEARVDYKKIMFIS